jgi:hypothetical protein
MISTGTHSVSIPRPVRQHSYNSESDFTHESGMSAASSSRPRKLRKSHSRVSADRLSSEGHPQASRSLGYERSRMSSDGTTPTLRFVYDLENISQNNSLEDLSSPAQDDGALRYGILTGPASSLNSPGAELPQDSSDVGPSCLVSSQDDMHVFVDRFRALVEQATRETNAGVDIIYDEDPELYDNHAIAFPAEEIHMPDEDTDDTHYVPVMGKIIQRMPTIESLGSREVMSLASGHRGDHRSVHTLSRPPTRANTLTMSEAAGSPSVSRSNSITASVVLASPVEAPASPTHEYSSDGTGASGNKSSHGSRSTGSSGAAPAGVDCAAALAHDARWIPPPPH